MMKIDQVAILVNAGENSAHSCVCKCDVYSFAASKHSTSLS